MTAPVIPLARKPAYTPLDEPGRCQTPGHEDRPARVYPGGRLCEGCIGASREAYSKIISDEKEARAS